MAVPAKTLLATGAAFAVGVGLTVSLMQPAPPSVAPAKPAPQAASEQASVPKAPATSVRAWVDPVKPVAPTVLAAVPSKAETPTPLADAAPVPVTDTAAAPQTLATPRKRIASHKATPSRTLASARAAKSRVAKARRPLDEYAVASAGPVSESTFVRREEAPYDPRYRQASYPPRGYVYADATGSYGDQRIEPRASARAQGGVIGWLMEPGTH